jgi:CRISPR/Cas system CSM-associated protein Csm3 (group 7 of RAMP superfamily)
METLRYQIKFYSDWHAGSGLTAGAASDALALRDEHGLPMIPGKTLKGLLRDSAVDLGLAQDRAANPSLPDTPEIETIFGVPHDIDKDTETTQGQCFFSDAVVSEADRKAIGTNKAMLFRKLASTAIDEASGTAKEHTLRTIEVAIPIVLEGSILLQDEKVSKDLLKRLLKGVKYLGLNRNRGLGRCEFICQ